MWFFGSRIQKEKMDRTTTQILELQSTKKELEIEIANQRTELDNERRRQKMVVEEEQHKHKLEMQSKDAEFARSKQVWEEDKARMKDQFEQEARDFEKRLQSQHDMKLLEAVTLAKLDSEQKVKQVEMDKLRIESEMKTAHSKALSDLQQKLSEEYHKKLNDALVKFNQEGTITTKFMTDLSLKLLDRAPASGAQVLLTGSYSDIKTAQ
jgi:hypothetical protein